MKLLLFDMGGFTFNDIKMSLIKAGHSVEGMYYHFTDKFKDEFFEERIRLQLRNNVYDAVISTNFYPLIAVACEEIGVPYISWSYDSPLEEKLEQYFGMDTNHIYLFDRDEVMKYNRKGHWNVKHLPLAINVERLDALHLSPMDKYKSDISFVGKIYDSVLDTLLAPADEYVKGYVEALFQSQIRLYGCNILEKNITDDIIERLNASYLKLGQKSEILTKQGLAYAIATQITHFERSFLINELAELYDLNVYTMTNIEMSDKVKMCGPVKYTDEMNYVFCSSKLNLCPTLKSISSGIPLRALDIMGAGGVLFSNYQPELAEMFVDGEDVIMYESIEDAFAKADFYLKNDDILGTIAANGNSKVRKYFNYDQRIETLLEINK